MPDFTVTILVTKQRTVTETRRFEKVIKAKDEDTAQEKAEAVIEEADLDNFDEADGQRWFGKGWVDVACGWSDDNCEIEYEAEVSSVEEA